MRRTCFLARWYSIVTRREIVRKDVQPVNEIETMRPRRAGGRKRLQQRLADTLEIRNRFAQCSTVYEAAQSAVQYSRDRIGAQVASVFLFSKRGLLERVTLDGVDMNNRPIEAAWFSEESYSPGESFTGKVVSPRDGAYGKPEWAKDVGRKRGIDPLSKGKYDQKLGVVRHALAVPLNGSHRTFGVLEVLNKLPVGSVGQGFTSDDVFWLSNIGNALAGVISQIRRREELELLREVSSLLVEPFGQGIIQHRALQQITDLLVSDSTSFVAAIIRVRRDSPGTCTTKAGVDISWNDWLEDTSSMSVCERVFQTGDPWYIPDVGQCLHEFRSRQWMEENHLRGYACIPLAVKTKTVGTLSVFTAFPHEFDDSDKAFLQHIAFLVASVTESYRVIQELTQIREETETQTDKLFGIARVVGFSVAEQHLVHTYRNELLVLQRKLKAAGDVSAGRGNRLLSEVSEWIDTRTESLRDKLIGTPLIPIQVNTVVRNLVKHFQNTQQGKKITFKTDLDEVLPRIAGREQEIADIVHNLLSNAVKAVRELARPGIITITTQVAMESRRPYIEILVDDNGCGIRGEDFPKLTTQGFSRYPDGTGMGLYLVERTLRRVYGGRVLPISSVLGKGTLMAVRIPLNRNRLDDLEEDDNE